MWNWGFAGWGMWGLLIFRSAADNRNYWEDSFVVAGSLFAILWEAGLRIHHHHQNRFVNLFLSFSEAYLSQGFVVV
jgi:hypothetical protein